MGMGACIDEVGAVVGLWGRGYFGEVDAFAEVALAVLGRDIGGGEMEVEVAGAVALNGLGDDLAMPIGVEAVEHDLPVAEEGAEGADGIAEKGVLGAMTAEAKERGGVDGHRDWGIGIGIGIENGIGR